MARVDLSTQLTAQETLVLQAITDGTYFVYRETPSGAVNGSNVTFTLANTPNPAASLCLFLNGQLLTLTEDYTLSGSTITFVAAPDSGSIIRASYSVDPN
jgi:hypothetical protein